MSRATGRFQPGEESIYDMSTYCKGLYGNLQKSGKFLPSVLNILGSL